MGWGWWGNCDGRRQLSNCDGSRHCTHCVIQRAMQKEVMCVQWSLHICFETLVDISCIMLAQFNVTTVHH